MVIKNETVIHKMINELQAALVKSNDSQKVAKHIENVQLLCELLLDGANKTIESNEITSREMQVMVGEKVKKQNTKKSITHDKANGDSIFDF